LQRRSKSKEEENEGEGKFEHDRMGEEVGGGAVSALLEGWKGGRGGYR
jgi:hypothetical protein